MQSDKQADLISDLGASEADAILSELEPDVASGSRPLADFEDDVAGSLMITEIGEDTTIGARVSRSHYMTPWPSMTVRAAPADATPYVRK